MIKSVACHIMTGTDIHTGLIYLENSKTQYYLREMCWMIDYQESNRKSESFQLCTGESSHQLGTAIIQDKKAMVFYLHKFNTDQKHHTTTETGLSSTIEACKE